MKNNLTIDDETVLKEVKDTEPLGLPVFSTGVKNALSEGKLAEVWGQMIDDLVMFYSRKYPTRLNCSEYYQIVGRLMFSTYPTIGRFGTHQWVSWNNYTIHTMDTKNLLLPKTPYPKRMCINVKFLNVFMVKNDQ